ncbi:hypothetical protein [Dokdonella koreensis]|uniref:Glycine zipper-like domain-containing protein n=1 Tax=Dokdonella koreensis DS-123 TaxID=1300342 RepID=A0A160DYB4_9GAMM|nr:hypothetical protein [Dokdonella koreensis]ANB19594.1 Hypothetical protein I596_3606 [Dokdonella koreensis DS-123]
MQPDNFTAASETTWSLIRTNATSQCGLAQTSGISRASRHIHGSVNMTASDDKTQEKKPLAGAGIAVGIAIGVALGAAFDQLALGTALGAAFGAAIDAVSHARRKKER